MAIKRGTTPTHIITTDVDLRDAKNIYITYSQNTYNVVEKTKDDLEELTEEYIKVRLTQSETLRFKEKGKILVQIRAIFADGTAIESNMMETNANKILKEGVI